MNVSKNLSEFFRWVLFLAYCWLLYFTHVLPSEEIPPSIARTNDKVLHFFIFLILALLAFRTFSHSRFSKFRIHPQGSATGFSLSYGAFLEWTQHWVPSRQMSFTDWVADALGILVAFFTFQLSPRLQKFADSPSR